jgi:hypothetical protein
MYRYRLVHVIIAHEKRPQPTFLWSLGEGTLMFMLAWLRRSEQSTKQVRPKPIQASNYTLNK